MMTLDLLERVFQNSEKVFTSVVEVKEIGIMFFNIAKQIRGDLQEDYWIQFSYDFDTNFYMLGDHWYMSIYRTKKNGTDTDTSASVSTILLDNPMTF